jgi:hypothetical protein
MSEKATVPDGGPYLTRGQRDMLKNYEAYERAKSKLCPICEKRMGNTRPNRDGSIEVYCKGCDLPRRPRPPGSSSSAPRPLATSAKRSDLARIALSQKKRRLMLTKHSSF